MGAASNDEGQSRKRKALGPPDACWFFMRGLCSKGEWCKWSHEPDLIAQAQVSEDAGTDFPAWKTEMCRFWIKKGTCRFGQYCLYAHNQQELRQRNQPVPQVAPTPGSLGQAGGQGLLESMQLGLGGLGGGAAHPGFGASSTAAALLGGGGMGAATPTPAQASLDEAMKQIQALQAAASGAGGVGGGGSSAQSSSGYAGAAALQNAAEAAQQSY